MANLALKPRLGEDNSEIQSMSTLRVKNCRTLSLLAAIALQEKLVALKQQGSRADILLFVEHPHVYTLGRGGSDVNVLAPKEVPVHRTSRGGDVTYHGPGQLIVYPIIDLRSKLRKDVHRYVRNLEQSAIQTLADFAIVAGRRPPHTGIWIDDRKIAAIGIAVRRCITYHGLALNVNTDLSFFQRIVPCGLAWAEVTSMRKELGVEPRMTDVRQRFLHHFAEIFGYHDIDEGIEQSGDLNVLNGLNVLNS
ncbi:MAG TPA: lipoyl(octanoyl) transferase LipB [Candidatus Limnocylindrales bacterium]|nr:lipoyl(octanoyl) transferase LipB [Candidatus Limnocylindrales bacterium]